MLRYLLFTSCMSSCTHCHVKMPKSWAECSPNPRCTHTHSVFSLRYRDPCFNPCLCLYSHNWMCRVGLCPVSEKIQRAQTVFVSHGFVCNPCWDWMASCWWSPCTENHPQSRGEEGYDPLTHLAALSCGWSWVEGELQETLHLSKITQDLWYCCNSEVSCCL